MPHDDDIITVSTYDAVSAADGDSSILPSGFQELSPVEKTDLLTSFCPLRKSTSKL